ncbi:hypothetical protein EDD80_101236 [Anseongella ginsenosidimutans]|uniref:Uncharacterized protein n=1 Tax=Anseongella ginsenosidimutans TaxID=496056 RepID=A0A4R3KX82_9SPHI|nr:hypothetical protein EDD80_101236 [Anseongella ginsenosidimutans]
MRRVTKFFPLLIPLRAIVLISMQKFLVLQYAAAGRATLYYARAGKKKGG